jgi:hypothetical protein
MTLTRLRLGKLSADNPVLLDYEFRMLNVPEHNPGLAPQGLASRGW